MSDKYPSLSSYVYCADNPVILVDQDGEDIVYMGEGGTEVKRIKDDKINKTYVTDINADRIQMTNLNGCGGMGWIEAPMPNLIEKETDSKYQKYDYLIAAEVSYFNQYKNKGETPKYTNGQSIDNSRTIPNLDPTLVKAIIMKETVMGTAPSRGLNDASSDIMQANVWYSKKSNDWNKSKEQFGLQRKGGATPYQSIHAGIGILYQKGLRTLRNSTTFMGWSIATDRYNGNGVKNYGECVRNMVKNSISY
ncbi:MAG: hypothetical protein LKE30_04770 [Bacteroidales bacterium]|jgi:hypothetical protein|nr:hypothetical protein [Bacteroidales bacterium]